MILFEQRFEILRPLGSGAMGLVFEALDRETQTKVALKTLRSMSAEALARFKSEFRDFQHLSHPNLVSLGELLHDDGTWFFTMELVHGTSLLEWVRGQRSNQAVETVVAPIERQTPVPMVTERQTPVPQAPRGTFDEVRTRDAMMQLARGISALHDAGKVHRDLKPDNVLVTAEGRVVLVDFGLGIDTEQQQVDEHEIVGTVAYMSPEQAAARRLSPASDWYAFGTMLFEALTGCIPFSGSAFEVLTAKQTQNAPSVRSLTPSAPPDLADLADALLRHEPSARPKGPPILAMLAGAQIGGSATTSLGQVFVGREKELDRLVEASRRIRAGQGPKVVLVTGESGLGKTSLLRQFDRRLRREVPGVWHLKGVCYERESTPYKGIDGALDELAMCLNEQPAGLTRAALPDDVLLLAEFFPVLGRVVPLDQPGRDLTAQRDPVVLRARLFSAVRELLTRASRDRLVLLQIEDLQWANADTWALLSELFQAPETSSLGFVFSLRSEDPRAGEWLARLEGLGPASVEVVRLERFSPAEGDALARTLLERLGSDVSAARAVTTEADGHPLFIDALVRAGSPARGEKLTLDEALWQRSQQLPQAAQLVLSLVALSKSAVVQQVAARAAELPPAEFNRHVAALRVLHLVRSTGVRQLDTVVPFHDRVRTAVRDHVDVEAARGLHRRMAAALEATSSTDLEALLWHWSEAAEPARAAVYAERAGEQAAQRLAFDRAAQLFGEALATGVLGPSDTQRLWARRGEVLTNAGRGADAAAAFLQAAKGTERSVALGFQRLAAEQLLRSGHIDDGLARLREVLSDVGETLAASPTRAVASLLLGRARLALRGLSFKERPREAITPEALLRIDATWAAANGLSSVDLIRGAEMQTRNLLLSLEAGELSRVARALSMESGIYSFSGPAARDKALQLNDRAKALCERLDDPLALAFVALTRGVIEFQALKWADCAPLVAQGLSFFEEKRTGAWWELTTARMFHLMSSYYLGRLDELALRIPTWIDESQRRDDLYALTNLRISHCSVLSLMKDEPEAGLEAVDAVMKRWSPKGYLAQHYYALLSRTSADLYRGDGAAAHQRVEREWAALKRSQLLRSFVLSVEAPYLRARAAVAEGSPKALALAKAIAKDLDRAGTLASSAFARGLEASLVAATKGDTSEALKVAAAAFDGAQLSMHATSARLLRGGPEAETARARLQQLGVRKPGVFARYLLPGAW